MPEPISPKQPEAPQVERPSGLTHPHSDMTTEGLVTKSLVSTNAFDPAFSTVHGDVATPLRAAHKKRKKAKKGMKPGAPAAVTIHGFDSPSVSCGEDSDTSGVRTPSLNFARTATPTTGSPLVRPSSLSRAISELKLGLKKTSPAASEDGDIGNGSSVSSKPSQRARSLTHD